MVIKLELQIVNCKSNKTIHKKFPLEKDGVLILGRSRSEADIHLLDDDKVSRKHGKIKFRDGKIILTDTSSNGTFVDEEKIKVIELKKNMTFKMGRHEILIVSIKTAKLPAQDAAPVPIAKKHSEAPKEKRETISASTQSRISKGPAADKLLPLEEFHPQGSVAIIDDWSNALSPMGFFTIIKNSFLKLRSEKNGYYRSQNFHGSIKNSLIVIYILMLLLNIIAPINYGSRLDFTILIFNPIMLTFAYFGYAFVLDFTSKFTKMSGDLSQYSRFLAHIQIIAFLVNLFAFIPFIGLPISILFGFIVTIWSYRNLNSIFNARWFFVLVITIFYLAVAIVPMGLVHTILVTKQDISDQEEISTNYLNKFSKMFGGERSKKLENIIKNSVNLAIFKTGQKFTYEVYYPTEGFMVFVEIISVDKESNLVEVSFKRADRKENEIIYTFTDHPQRLKEEKMINTLALENSEAIKRNSTRFQIAAGKFAASNLLARGISGELQNKIGFVALIATLGSNNKKIKEDSKLINIRGIPSHLHYDVNNFNMDNWPTRNKDLYATSPDYPLATYMEGGSGKERFYWKIVK